MADQIVTLNGFPIKLHDNGDGTYSTTAYQYVSSNTISTPPVVAVKTVGAVPMEMFVGNSSRLAGRYTMIVYNNSNNVIYWSGDVSVSVANGFPLQPGDYVTFQFSPQVGVPIYFVAASNSSVRVVELK